MEVDGLRDDWRFTLGVISGGHFFSHFYLLAFPPLFPILRAEFGLSNTELGLLLSVMSAAGLLQAPVGRVVDRIGAKRIFVGAVGLTAAGVALTSLATSYATLLVLMGLSGLGQPMFHPADYAMIDTVVDEQQKGRSFSLHTFSGYAGFAAAPVVVSAIALAADWRVAVIAVGAVGLCYAVVAAVVLKPHYLDALASERERAEPAPADGGGPTSVFNWSIATLFLYFVVVFVAEKAAQAFAPILGTEAFGLSTAVGSTALTGFFGVAAVGILVGGVAADRFPPRRIIIACLAAAAIVLWTGLSGLVTMGALGFVAMFSAIGFLRGLVSPARDRLVTAAAPAGSTGTSFGVVFTGLSVGAMIGPTLWGAVIDATSAHFTFVLVGFVFVAAAGIAAAVAEDGAPTPRAAVGDD